MKFSVACYYYKLSMSVFFLGKGELVFSKFKLWIIVFFPLSKNVMTFPFLEINTIYEFGSI